MWSKRLRSLARAPALVTAAGALLAALAACGQKGPLTLPPPASAAASPPATAASSPSRAP